jgi:hypothetical protein
MGLAVAVAVMGVAAPGLVEVQVAVYPVMVLLPLLAGAVKLTLNDPVASSVTAGAALTVVGTPGTVDTAKLRTIEVAASYVALPGCLAWIMQVPTPIRVIVAPLTPPAAHTDGVEDENDTGRPDDAVAATMTGDCANVLAANAPKVIVCGFFDTVKLWGTDAAGPYVASPAWSAWTVHVPAATRVIVAPSVPVEVHTDGVVDEKDTGRPDEAVAVTVTGDCTNVLAANAPKVIVCDAADTVKLCGTDAAGPYVASPA